MNGPIRRRARRQGTTVSAPVSLGMRQPAALGPSNQSALQRLTPTIPRLSFADLQAVLAESERPIRAWLDENEARVRGLSLAAATAEVLRNVPGAADQGAGSVASTIQHWARERGITLPSLSIVPHAADAGATAAPRQAGDSELVSAVRGAIRAVSEGVKVERGPAFVRLSASGATAGLRHSGARTTATVTPTCGVRGRIESQEGFAEVTERGVTVGATAPGVRVTTGVTWSGDLRFATSIRNFNLSMSLSAERWLMQLTFPTGQMPADLSTLGAVFGAGESALRASLVEVSGFRSIDEIPDLAARISPHVAPVRRAVETATRIARTPPGISFGIRAEGPTRGAGPGGGPNPAASRVFGVLTIRF